MARRRLTPAVPGAPAPADLTSDAAASPRFARETSILPGGAVSAGPVPPIARVAGEASAAAALSRMAQGLEEARASGRMVVDIELQDVAPDFLLRDRLVVDAEEIDVLKASIRQHGQRVPAEVTPLVSDGEGRTWGLISGWRRLRALIELHAETGEPRFARLRALVRPPEEAAESYIAMVEENEIRVGISYYERARVVAETTARGVFPDQQAALVALFGAASRAKRSKIGSFVELHRALGDLLYFPADIPERLGLALVAQLRAGGAAELRRVLKAGAPATAESEQAMLAQLARGGDVSRAKREPAKTSGTSEKLGSSGLTLKTQERAGRLVLTLSGPGADAALLERLRGLLLETLG